EPGTDVSKADGSAALRALEPARHDHGHGAESRLSDSPQHTVVHDEVTERLQGAARHQRPTAQKCGDAKDQARTIAIQQPANQGCADDGYEHIDRVGTGATGTAPGKDSDEGVVEDRKATANAAGPG